MTDNLREIVLGVLAAGIAGALGWFARTYLWRRGLRRRQRFFGLLPHSECVLVVNRDPAAESWAVARRDVFALLELAALIKDCGSNADIVEHDAVQQSFGERTEFCVGGPASNRRTAAHLESLLPGVKVNTDGEPGPDRASFTIGGERHLLEKGVSEHVLIARLTAGGGEATRPTFLLAGQSGITNQAAARYLARNQARLIRKYGRKGTFCLLLKVRHSHAYGPDVVEQAADVTRAATTPRRESGGAAERTAEAQSSESSA